MIIRLRGRSVPELGSTAQKRRYALAFAAPMLFAALVALSVWPRGPASISFGPQTAEAELKRYLDGKLITRGRLVGVNPPTGKGEKLEKKNAISLARTVRLIASKHTSIEGSRALAVLDLVEDDVTSAISRLEALVRSTPKEPRLRNDLAVAYLEAAEKGHSFHSLVLSLASLEEALRLNEKLPEAIFNRALVLEEIGLQAEAFDAWKHYEEAGDSSGRLRAAKPRVGWYRDQVGSLKRNRLSGALTGSPYDIRSAIKKFPQSSRELTENELLPRWGDAFLRQDQVEAVRLTRALREIGAAFAGTKSDFLLEDALAAIRGSSSLRSRESAIGFKAYKFGLSLLEDGRVEEALKNLEEAASYLHGSGNPFALRAALEVVLCKIYLDDFKGAEKGLSIIRSSLNTQRHISLSARMYWLSGLLQIKSSRLDSSYAYYRESLAKYVLLGEDENIAAIETLLAENLRIQGDVEGAWNHRGRALYIASHLPQPSVRLHNALFDSAEAAASEKLYHVALTFQNEMIRVAERLGDPVLVAEAFIRRGKSFVGNGNLAAGRKDLKSASVAARRAKSLAWRLGLQADIARVSGEILLGLDPKRAIAEFSRAIEYQEASGSRYRLSELCELRSQGFNAVGDERLASEDMLTAIQEAETVLEDIKSQPLKIAYFDRAVSIFDRGIKLELSRGNLVQSFTFDERSRARHITIRNGLRVVAPDRIANVLPGDAAILKYAVLGDSVVCWVVEGRRVSFVPIAAGSSDLLKAVEVVLVSLQEGRDSTLAYDALEYLYKELIGPAKSFLVDKRRLVVVPDEFLYRIPFSALRNGDTGRYLIEDLTIVQSSSASLFALGYNAGRRIDRNTPALVLGNPWVRRSLLPDLPSLDGAEIEAQKVMRFYENSFFLRGREAHKQAFVAKAPLSSVIHIAAHAQVNDEFPLFSSIIMAPNSTLTESGIMYAHEISRLDLNFVEVVVLAGCETSSGPISRSEGPLSLVRPFLNAGAKAVVASLWRVRDQGTGELLINFHAGLRNGDGPAEALREAQLLSLRSDDAFQRWPGNWSVYQITGMRF